MEIVDIIKESFVVPSQNLEKLAIYIVVTFIIGLLSAGGAIISVFGVVDNSAIFIFTGILMLIGLVFRLILRGYQLSIIKSGIDNDENAPGFAWKDNLINGIKLLILAIVYFIIPIIVVMVLAFIFNIPGQIGEILQYNSLTPQNLTAMVNANVVPVLQIPDAMGANLAASIGIVGLIAAVLFIIFGFLEIIGEARLANTSSLGDSVNMMESYRDITKIGFGKVVATLLLMIVVAVIITGILRFVAGQIPILAILSIIVSPYLVFFTNRVTGLLYSDIA